MKPKGPHALAQAVSLTFAPAVKNHSTAQHPVERCSRGPISPTPRQPQSFQGALAAKGASGACDGSSFIHRYFNWMVIPTAAFPVNLFIKAQCGNGNVICFLFFPQKRERNKLCYKQNSESNEGSTYVAAGTINQEVSSEHQKPLIPQKKWRTFGFKCFSFVFKMRLVSIQLLFK